MPSYKVWHVCFDCRSITNDLGTCKSGVVGIIEDRHGKTSTIITSQIPISTWHDIIGEQKIADAILGRIVDDAYSFEMKGESLRKKKRSKNEEEIDFENLKN